MKALLALLKKEAYHIRRDPRTLAIVLALPVVQVVLFGFAIRTDVDHVRLAIVDPSPDDSTIALRNRFAAAGVFEIVAVVPATADLDPLFKSGAAQEAVVFGHDFGADLSRSEPAQLLIVTDATEPNTGSLFQSYARAVVETYSRELGPANAATAPGSGPLPRIAVTSRMRFNPTRESSNLFVPGLMAFVLTIISSLMTAITLTREKETGTLEALLVSPLRPWSIVVGKVLPYLLIAFVAAVAVLVEARLVFRVPIRGSVALLLGETLLFILSSLAFGLLVSARTSSQRVAMMGAALATMLPNLLLSGFIFPVESMPAPLQAISVAVGARWFVTIVRSIMLKGVGLEYLWQETLILAGMSAFLLFAGMRSFKARLESSGMRRILALARTELLHIVRDRATLVQVMVVPILQLLVLANAATFEIRNTPAWIVDLDRTASSRGVIARLAASGHFRIVGDVPSFDVANDAMLGGEVTVIVVIPHRFEASLVKSGAAGIELSVNAEKGSAAGIVQSYASSILADYSRELAGPSSRAPRIEIRARSRYNPTMNYRHYMVPGILVALVTMIGTLLTAQNIAREKELGTLEQLNVTPITRGQFIVGKLLPFWGLGLVELGLGLAVGVLVFDVPVRGSVLLLFGVAAVYLLVALGIGLYVSTVVETQQQAMFVTFFIINIYLLMSGLLTPVDSMAPWVQTASQINPVRHFVTISRAILMKGAGLADILRPLVLLVCSAAVVLTVAVARYRKRTA